MKSTFTYIRRSAGFTLLELIIVMLILCTILGMAGPSLKGFFAMRRIEDTAARIVALAKYAKSQAVCEGRTYRLNFDLINKTYWLTVQDKGTFRELEMNLGRIFMLPGDVRMEVSDLTSDGVIRYAQFNPSGRISPGTILLTGPRGDQLHIMCRSATESYVVVDEKEVRYEAGL